MVVDHLLPRFHSQHLTRRSHKKTTCVLAFSLCGVSTCSRDSLDTWPSVVWSRLPTLLVRPVTVVSPECSSGIAGTGKQGVCGFACAPWSRQGSLLATAISTPVCCPFRHWWEHAACAPSCHCTPISDVAKKGVRTAPTTTRTALRTPRTTHKITAHVAPMETL